MSNSALFNIRELNNHFNVISAFDCNVICFQLNYSDRDLISQRSVFLESYFYILVTNGASDIDINGKKSRIIKNDIAILTSLHSFNFENISEDFESTILLLNKSFFDGIPFNEKLYNFIAFYNHPIVRLSTENFISLNKSILSISNRLLSPTEMLFTEIIQTCISCFLLELTNFVESSRSKIVSVKLSRYEKIFNLFTVSLLKNYKKRHHNSFYAEAQNITPQYLSKVIKKIGGKTVNEFIGEMLYTEAQFLLNNSDLSIQNVAEKLNFADQSSFGKFFKRKAGLSPYEFRNLRINREKVLE